MLVLPLMQDIVSLLALKEDEDQDVLRKVLMMGFLSDQVSTNAVKACGNNNFVFEIFDFVQGHYNCDCCEIGRSDKKCWERKTWDVAYRTCLNEEEDQDLIRKLIRMGFPVDQVSKVVKVLLLDKLQTCKYRI